MDKIANAKKILLKLKTKQTRPYRFTTRFTEEEVKLSNQWAKDYNLLESCGSDFHGWPNQRIQIGNLIELPNPKRAVWRHI